MQGSAGGLAGHTRGSVDMHSVHKPLAWSCTGWPGAAPHPPADLSHIDSSIGGRPCTLNCWPGDNCDRCVHSR